MHLGYFTMPLHPPGSDLAQTLADDLEQLETVDRLGFAEAWVGEHFTSEWENIPCPDLLLAQALVRTKQIVLGTGVSCLPNHNPVMLAHRIAQLDQMARGRFLWGIGSGGFYGDFELFDVDAEHGESRRLTHEVLDAVLTIWGNPPVGRQEHPRWRFRVPEYQADIGLRLHVAPYQTPHPPIAVAGLSPRSAMLSLAGERDWIPMSINFIPPATLRTQWQTYAESAERHGHFADRARWRVCRDIYIAETSEQARHDVLNGVLARDWRDYFLRSLGKSRMLGAMKVDPDMPDRDVTPEYLCDNIWIVGDKEEVTQKLRKLQSDIGGFGTLLAMGHEWLPGENWVHSMEVLAGEVLPTLNADF